MKMEDYNEYYIQGSDHYLIPKDVFKELFNEMINWKEESQMNNNDYRREEFEKRRNYKGAISMCEGYDCPIFMNCLLEIKKLQQENKILKENAENNDKVVDIVNWGNMLLKKENQQLKNNWNKLKEYLETCISIIKKNPIDKRTSFEHSSLSSLGATLSKMQELEQGSDSNVKD